MDGIDTLCQVALADQLNLSFDTYNPNVLQTANTGHTGLDADDSLNTPVTTSSDMPTFFSSDTDFVSEPLPITGRLKFTCIRVRFLYLSLSCPLIGCHFIALTCHTHSTHTIDNPLQCTGTGFVNFPLVLFNLRFELGNV